MTEEALFHAMLAVAIRRFSRLNRGPAGSPLKS
jgi:hypothetical protein